ncbi:two-component hybrid sensor and regulator [Alcanivorax xiamenensis]|uniref:Two-component hybrid sensor and regulator n=1 Tax=Alcanivorax xiamenensis TaxID=1177156 RepID=A0ABQ6YAB1_9GAMM|nr:Hpt domain-containing protein [Alcanivorax xiamenensis]KAF0806757.1 two-component hybrid sensor and regulator [Alcanivorax xiamenensis]
MSRQEAVDLAVIQELKEVMGADFPRLVMSFVKDGEQRLRAIQDGLAATDTEVVRQQAHSFKGSSGNLGAVRVSALCLEMESAARDGDVAMAASLLDPLKEAFESVCARLKSL